MALTEFLSWLTGPDGGAFLLIAWVIAWGLEEWPKWMALGRKLKQLIILGIAILLGLVATWLQSQPDFVSVIEPYFRAVSYAVLAWLVTQTAHKLDKG